VRHAGIPVPPGPEDGWPGPFIVKRATEHASQGLGPHSVVEKLPPLEPGWYAEAFIAGREYSVSMLADGRGGCTILPTAELVYAEQWPADMPRILDYDAKWDHEHPLYALTHSRFSDPGEFGPLARHVWDALGLAGYARIDLRVGADGVAYVIDVNANPCLSEDAGFAEAAAQAGLDYTALIGCIVEVTTIRPGEHRHQEKNASSTVMAGRDPAIPDFLPDLKTWMPGSSPGMTEWNGDGSRVRHHPADGAPETPAYSLRGHLVPADRAAIGALCRGTGFFRAAEIAIAEELAADRLGRGEASDYRFLIVDAPDERLLGYACYGPIAGTTSAWDLYWIVVDRAAQGAGIGRHLLQAVIEDAAAGGCTGLYAETEASPLYAPTRAFYAGCGFLLQAVLPDFYAPGAGKQIWMRAVRRTGL
jgi:GNAT superfamily N-acetyltransferase